MQVPAVPDWRSGMGTTRMVNWAGCLVQEPPTAVRALGYLPPNGHGAYIARSVPEYLPRGYLPRGCPSRVLLLPSMSMLIHSTPVGQGPIGNSPVGYCWCTASGRWCHGSPAHKYGLYALHWIAEINGEPIPDLDALVAVTQVRQPSIRGRTVLWCTLSATMLLYGMQGVPELLQKGW